MMEFARYGIDGAARGSLGLGFETALACVDRSGWDADRPGVSAGPGWTANGSTRMDILPPDAAEFFRAERLRPGPGGEICLAASFSILVAVEGTGSVESQSARLRIARGDTVLVPYAAGDLTVAGDVTIIRCRPPAVPEQETPKKGVHRNMVNRRAATMHDVAKLANVSAKTVFARFQRRAARHEKDPRQSRTSDEGAELRAQHAGALLPRWLLAWGARSCSSRRSRLGQRGDRL